LFSLTYFYNGRYHYDNTFNPHSEVLVGLCETFQRMALAAKTGIAINQQLEKFKGVKGLFGMDIAIDTRNNEQPDN